MRPRYPSLYEDFEPFFRRNPRHRQVASPDSTNEEDIPLESDYPNIPVVRVIAALAIIVMIAALMVFA